MSGNEVADDRVVEALGAAAVAADIVGSPAGAELVAVGGQLTDQVVELLVVGVVSQTKASFTLSHSGLKLSSAK